MLAVFAFILPFVSDVIFIPFEMFVAVVQALVFSMLTLVLLQIATTSEHNEPESQHEARADFAPRHVESTRPGNGGALTRLMQGSAMPRVDCTITKIATRSNFRCDCIN